MSDRIRVGLIDADPIWQLGLYTALAEFSQLQVTLVNLEEPQEVDLIIWGIPDWNYAVRLTTWPRGIILVITPGATAEQLQQMSSLGIRGHWQRGQSLETLVAAIEEVAKGGSFWSEPQPNLLPVLYRQAQAGLGQIILSLQTIERYLETTSGWSRLFWLGRRRELQTAAWLVQQLLPINAQPAPRLVAEPAELVKPAELTVSPQWGLQPNLEGSLNNLTRIPLEIDILAEAKKRQLLYMVWEKFQAICQSLAEAEVSQKQLSTKKSQILMDLWQAVTVDYIGRYTTAKIANAEVELVPRLLLAEEQMLILNQIPGVEDLLGYLINHSPVTIDNTTYAHGSPEAIARAELLLENLLIQVANAVMQPLLNNFADLETIKQNFYDYRLISTREITKLRNNLAWKYRWEYLWINPRLIFESSYRLWAFSSNGIRTTIIYAPRYQELNQLKGWQYWVTLGLEFQDAIAPGLQIVFSWLGRWLVFILTQVIGRGLGLIGRGILQGIGNSLQDLGRDSRKNKL